MIAQVEVCSGMDPLYFFKSERKFKFDIYCCICVMRQFIMVVKAQAVRWDPQGSMPSHSDVLPMLIPLFFFSRADEKLHFHLLEFAHAENKLSCHNLIPKGFTYLCNTERNFHAGGFLYVQKVNKYSLRSFRSQVNFVGIIGHRPYFGGKHEVELSYVRPVAGARDGAFDVIVDD